jgi:hypothetical protein
VSTRVIVVRGHQATPWELAPWEHLPGDFEVTLLRSRLNSWDIGGVALQRRDARTLLDRLPHVVGGRLSGLMGDRYCVELTSCTSRSSRTGSARTWRGSAHAVLASGS